MSAISESIRKTALTWPYRLADSLESDILHFAFLMPRDMDHDFIGDSVRNRTYMLLVAEALE